MKQVARSLSTSLSFSFLFRFLLIFSALTVTMGGNARAQVTSTWNTTTGSWASPATNWSNNAIPGATSGVSSPDTAVFGSSGAGTVTVDTYRNIDNITFNGSSAYTLSGGNLYLTNGGELQNTSSSTAIQNINTPINLEGNYTFDSSSGTTADVLLFGGSANISEQATGILTLQGTNTGTNTINGVISDSVSTPLTLSKTGSGTWILENANTYRGGTIISSGKLLVGNSASLGTGTITLSGGALGGMGNVTIANNIVAQAGTTSILYPSDLLSTGNTVISGNISGSGNLTTAAVDGGGGTSFILQGDDSGFTGTFTIPIGITNNNFRFRSASSGSAGAVWILNSSVTIGASANPFSGPIQFGSLTGSGNISTENSSNDIIQEGALNLNDLYSGTIGATFGLTKVGTGTLTLSNNQGITLATTVSGGTLVLGNGSGGGIGSTSGISIASGASITFNQGNGTTTSAAIANNGGITGAETTGNINTLGGIISGTGSFTQTGLGTTVLTAVDTYTGTTTINAGTLQLGNGTSNGSVNNSSITLGSTGTLAFNETNGTTLSSDINTSGTLGGAEAAGVTNILSGIISGSGGFKQTGSGTTTLSGANTYTGATSFNAGTLLAGIGSASGTGPFGYNSAVTGGGGILNLNNFNVSIGSLAGSGTVAMGTGTLTVGGNNASPATYSGNITGSGGLVKVGTGTLNLSGSSTYSGGTVIDSGPVLLGNGSSLGTGTITLAGGALVGNGNFTLTNSIVAQAGTNSLLYIVANQGNLNLTGNITGSGNISTGTLGGYDSLYFGGNNSGFTGTFTFAQYTTNTMYFRFNSVNAGSANASWVFNNSNGGTTFNIGSGTIQFGSFTGNGSFSSNGVTIQAGALGYNDFWAGSLTGPYTKVGTGTQTFTGSNSIGSTTINGGTLQIGNGGTTGSTGGSFVDNANLALDRSDSPTFSNISGTGTVTMMGTGTTTLNGTNTYSGATIVQSGTLLAGNANAFGTNSAVVMSNVSGATLALAGNNTQIGSLTGGGSLGGNVTLGGATLTVGGDNTSPAVFAGIISSTGSGAVTKIGTGTEIFSGANTYSGATTISAGTLQLGAGGASGSLATTSSVVDNGNFGIDRSDSVSQGGIFSGSAISGTGTFTQMGSGTTTLTAANTYSGGTSVLSGTLFANGGVSGSSSATGTGGVNVSSSAIFGGSGVIRPTINGKGVVLAGGSTLISGGVQAAVSPTTAAGKGLTLDNTGETTPGVILNAAPSLGTANLTFYLGYGATTNAANNAGPWTWSTPDTNSSYMTVVGNTAGELAFKTGDVITVNDLTGGNLSLLTLDTPYLLIQAGSDADYSGLLTTGMTSLSDPEANGFVTNLTLSGTAAGAYPGLRLFLQNGELEVVPEPGTWALMIGGLGLLIVLQRRKRKQI
jgi:fibronectin-binding autotransporter adhesin